MKFNSLLRGLVVLVPTFFVSAAALVASSGYNTFTITVIGTFIGAGIASVILRAREGNPAREMHPAALGIGLANCGSMFFLIPAVQIVGVGPATTIFALGAILVSVRSHPLWGALAVIGVGCVNQAWNVAGDAGGQAVGLLLALLAMASNYLYIRIAFGGAIPTQARPRVIGMGLAYTALVSAVIGVLGHALFGLGQIPAGAQVVPMLLIGALLWTVPGVAQAVAAKLIPASVSGFVFMTSTAASAATGAVAALLGYPKQAPTPLGWAGVAIVIATMAGVTWSEMRRKKTTAEIEEAVRK